MVEILVVDDNLQLRDTLRTILNKRPGFCVTGEAADGIAVLGQIGCLEQVTPDVRRGRPRHLLDADHQHASFGERERVAVFARVQLADVGRE